MQEEVEGIIRGGVMQVEATRAGVTRVVAIQGGPTLVGDVVDGAVIGERDMSEMIIESML